MSYKNVANTAKKFPLDLYSDRAARLNEFEAASKLPELHYALIIKAIFCRSKALTLVLLYAKLVQVGFVIRRALIALCTKRQKVSQLCVSTEIVSWISTTPLQQTALCPKLTGCFTLQIPINYK